MLDQADRGLSAIKTDIAELREGRAGKQAGAARHHMQVVSPMSRLVPHGRLRAIKIAFAALALAAAGAWATGLLDTPQPDEPVLQASSPPERERSDWAETWQPGKTVVQPASASAVVIQGHAVPSAPASGGIELAGPAPRREDLMPEGEKEKPSRRAPAARATTGASSSAANREWTGKFFER